jgi:hypothetical protein
MPTPQQAARQRGRPLPQSPYKLMNIGRFSISKIAADEDFIVDFARDSPAPGEQKNIRHVKTLLFPGYAQAA